MTKSNDDAVVGGRRVAADDKTFIAELQHRVRSTLATTRLIVRRSAETSEDLEDYTAHLDGRLAALGRVQQAAIHDPLAGLDLGLMVSDELASAAIGDATRLGVEGPTILLHPRAAESFALAAHELTINALKFGALSQPGGRVAVSWRIEPTGGSVPLLHFEWTEHGGAPIAADAMRKGFGTVVLHEVLGYNLGARTVLHFAATGLVCRIVIPLSDRIVVARL